MRQNAAKESIENFHRIFPFKGGFTVTFHIQPDLLRMWMKLRKYKRRAKLQISEGRCEKLHLWHKKRFFYVNTSNFLPSPPLIVSEYAIN